MSQMKYIPQSQGKFFKNKKPRQRFKVFSAYPIRDLSKLSIEDILSSDAKSLEWYQHSKRMNWIKGLDRKYNLIFVNKRYTKL